MTKKYSNGSFSELGSWKYVFFAFLFVAVAYLIGRGVLAILALL